MRTIESYLRQVGEALPQDLVTISEPVKPSQFEVTALLQHLENAGKYPLLLFENPLNLHGEKSVFRLATNIYATRQRCALALDLDPADWKLGLSLEYARREDKLIKPVIISKSEAPVKQNVKSGNNVDLRELPIVRHHEMDGGPYIDMTVAMRDPDQGFYNASFHRTQYKEPQKLGIHLSPRHNWTVRPKERGEKSSHPGRYHCEPSSCFLSGCPECGPVWCQRL